MFKVKGQTFIILQMMKPRQAFCKTLLYFLDTQIISGITDNIFRESPLILVVVYCRSDNTSISCVENE